MTKKTGGHLGPPHAHFFPKSPDQNCETAILFSIVKKNLKTMSPWEGLQVTNFDQCLHIVMVIGKFTYTFRGFFGWGRGLWGELSMEEFVMGEVNFHERGAGFFSIFLKSIEKTNMKKFLQLIERSRIKT